MTSARSLSLCRKVEEIKVLLLCAKAFETMEFSVFNDYDALAIPGGFREFGFKEEAFHSKTQNLIRTFHGQGKIIAAVCVAFQLLEMLIGTEKMYEVKCAMGYDS